MDPVISPWWFYLFHITEAVEIVKCAIAIPAGLALLFFTVAYVICGADDSINGNLPFLKKAARKAGTIFAAALLVVVLVPRPKWVIGMVVADFITHDRVAGMIDAGKVVKDELRDDMLAIIDAIKDNPARERERREEK